MNNIENRENKLPKIVSEADFSFPLLEKEQKILVTRPDGTILYLHTSKNGKKVTVIYDYDIQQVYNTNSSTNSVAKIVSPQKLSELTKITPQSTFFRNKFTFSSETMNEFLSFEAKEAFNNVIESIISLGGDVDSDALLQKVLEIRKNQHHGLEGILAVIESMDCRELEMFLQTENPCSFFERYVSKRWMLDDIDEESEEEEDDEPQNLYDALDYYGFTVDEPDMYDKDYDAQ